MQKVKNTAPLTIGEAPNQMRLTRRFLGEINPKNGYDKAEKKAYLKGQSRFNYKSRNLLNGAAAYEVRQEYFYEPAIN